MTSTASARVDHAPASQSIPKATDMTLRDYFAAQSLTGLINEIYRVASQAGPIKGGIDMPVAVMAYEIADAMLSARQGETK